MSDSSSNERVRSESEGGPIDPNPRPAQDISDLSFPPAPPHVIDEDTRSQVADDSLFPGLAHLTVVTKSAGNFPATGWFIGSRTLITAGHVVFLSDLNRFNPETGESGEWVDRILVSPRRIGPPVPNAVETNIFFADSGWVRSGDITLDYGAIVLDQDFPGITPIEVRPDVHHGNAIRIAGYPRIRPRTQETANGTLWQAAGLVSSIEAQRIFYDVDTTNGQSGSPVTTDGADSSVAVAVHTRGGPQNSGIRLTDRVLQNFERWRQM